MAEETLVSSVADRFHQGDYGLPSSTSSQGENLNSVFTPRIMLRQLGTPLGRRVVDEIALRSEYPA